jgi:hydrophobic/amphiphilic exporter-1 (mainly G- bacteria), HAE1 family
MIRSFVTFAVTKSTLNHLILAFFIVMSIMAYQSIPKELFPPAQRDKVVITGFYAGASAEVLDKMAVDKLEEQLQTLAAIDGVTSTIQNGRFTISADLKTGSPRVLVLSNVKDIIATVKKDLPPDMNEPTAKIGEQAIPLVQVAIASDIDLAKLIEYAKDVKDDIASLQDLSKVSLYGTADRELVIQINEKKVSALGLDLSSVVSAISNISSIFPLGNIDESGKHLYISTINGEKQEKAYQNMLLKSGRKSFRLADVAEVRFQLSSRNEISHFNGQNNVSLNILKSKTGNAIALVKQIKEILKHHEEKHSQLRLSIYSDSSVYIKNRLNTVVSNIVFGLILLFIALFLTVNRGIALVVAMGIPLSFMVALVFSNMFGFSLNLLSLLGALLALGMLVDEAIVVAENIYRHMEMGKDKLQAAIDGSVEMFPAVLAATLTTIFAFLPLLLMSGDMGVFMRILPIMISVLLISSLFEAFYFLPLHAKDLIRAREHTSKSHSFWKKLNTNYAKVLHKLFSYRLKGLVALVLSIFFAIWFLGSQSRFQLFTDFDGTQVFISGKVNINNDLYESEALVAKIEKILLEKFDMKNEVDHMTSVIGIRMDAKNRIEVGHNLFHMFIDLHERKPVNVFDRFINPYLSPEYDASKLKRDRSVNDVVKDMRVWLQELKNSERHGEKIFEAFEIVKPGAGVIAHDLEITLTGASDERLIEGIKRLERRLKEIPTVYNVSNDTQEGESELKLRVNRYGQELGFSENSVAQVVQSMHLKAEYSKMFDDEGLISIKVVNEHKDQFKALNTLELTALNNEKVKLSDICEMSIVKSFSKISKDDGMRIRTVFGSFEKDKTSSGIVMDQLKSTLDELSTEGISVVIKGEEQENNRIVEELTYIAFIAIFLIFMTLVWMFDSFILSMMVLSTIPLSVLGVYLGNLIMGIDLTFPGLMGLVGLAGVVVNDGLIMIDFIRKAETLDEVVHYAVMRIRPILLTSITTVLGLSTMIFFASGQALILQPMAVALGFGVAWATVLNLLYIPLLYIVVKRIR